MPFKDLKAVIDFAVEKEKEAAAFYEEAGREESMSGKREMLLEFAGEERKHRAMLENMDTAGIEETVSRYKLKWVTNLKRSDYLVDMEYKKGMPYNEILGIATKREEKSLKLYNELLAHADEDKQKKLFKLLCQEEAKHKLALETLLDDYMAKMGD